MFVLHRERGTGVGVGEGWWGGVGERRESWGEEIGGGGGDEERGGGEERGGDISIYI